MDLGVIITACIGIVTTFFSSLITRIFTKKKYNAAGEIIEEVTKEEEKK